MTSNWDDYLMGFAQHAATKSKDPHTKVGAVIVNPETKQILSTGYNGPPRGYDDASVPLTRPEKYLYFEHAERNAIYAAAYNGVQTRGAHLYCTLIPCFDCIRGIHQAGITLVAFDVANSVTRYGDSDEYWERYYFMEELYISRYGMNFPPDWNDN